MSSDVHASDARLDAADALRRLGHALVGHEIDDDTFTAIATWARAQLPTIAAGAPRSRPVDDMKRRLFDAPPADGDSMDHFPCPVAPTPWGSPSMSTARVTTPSPA